MRGLAVAAVAAVLLWAVVSAASLAVIEKTDVAGEHLRITFDKGAIGACTVFQEQVVREDMREYFADGMYAPRSCGGFDPDQTSYDDTWDFIERNTPPTKWLVWSEIQYDLSGAVVKSNQVEVTR